VFWKRGVPATAAIVLQEGQEEKKKKKKREKGVLADVGLLLQL